jgi:hypothetical protein
VKERRRLQRDGRRDDALAAGDTKRVRDRGEEPYGQRRREHRRRIVVAVPPARRNRVALVRDLPFVLEERTLAAAARTRAHAALAQVGLRRAQRAQHGAQPRAQRCGRRQRREHRAGTRQAHEATNSRREASGEAHEAESYPARVPAASKGTAGTKGQRAPPDP